MCKVQEVKDPIMKTENDKVENGICYYSKLPKEYKKRRKEVEDYNKKLIEIQREMDKSYDQY